MRDPIPWPVWLGMAAVVITAVAWMAVPTTGTIIALLILWAVVIWLYKGWEQRHPEGR